MAFFYLANLNYTDEVAKTVQIEVCQPIHKGEVVAIEPNRFLVFEVRHVITESGSTTYLDCDKM